MEPSTAPEGQPVLSAEQQLQQLQEKTAAWKQAVAAQLSDAAKKNKVLRDELQKARDEREVDLGNLRVQMNREFKERTAMKEDEVTQLHEKLDELYAQQKKAAAAHVQDITRVEQRTREACLLEAAQERQKAVDEVRQQIAAMEARIEDKTGELAHEKETVSSLTTRLERLGNQYQELSSLLHRRSGGKAANEASPSSPASPASGDMEASDAILSASSSPSAVVAVVDGADVHAALHDTDHQRQLDEVQAALHEREREVQRELDAARRDHQLHTTNLIRELHRRDDHTVMLQTLQKQLQQDLMNAQLRLTAAQEEKAALEQRLAGKVAALSKELADRLEAQSQAQHMYDQLLAQDRAHVAHIEELESEASSREEAFRALMLSDEDKRLVRELEHQLHGAREEADAYKTQLDAMLARVQAHDGLRDHHSVVAAEALSLGLESRSSTPIATTTTTSAGGGDLRESSTGHRAEDIAHRLQLKAVQLQQREQAMEQERASLEEQRERQRAMEAKLDSMKRSLAAQANDVFRQQQTTTMTPDGEDDDGDHHHNNNRGGWGTLYDTSESSASATNKVLSRGSHNNNNNNNNNTTHNGVGASSRRAPLSFDANAAAAASGARRGWAGTVGAGGGLLARVPSRLRVLIPVFLFLFVFFSVLNMRAGDEVAKKSAHMPQAR